jgi:hypothetical protein
VHAKGKVSFEDSGETEDNAWNAAAELQARWRCKPPVEASRLRWRVVGRAAAQPAKSSWIFGP